METELLLLNSAKKMNKDALVRIFDLYASPLYNYALRLYGDRLLADHIVGEAFAKLLDQFASGKGPTSTLRSHLYETAYHIIVDEARSSRRRATLEALTSLRSDVGSGLLSSEEQIMFESPDAIQHGLTDNQWHVIITLPEEFVMRPAILQK
jgi:DNA-directed RNA polymerase specialized sigma24 family protein